MRFFTPPSALPGISPARREITPLIAFANRQHQRLAITMKILISPLAGEMSGRTEGGVTERNIPITSVGLTGLHHP
ncbi:MAG: hypothetical protein BGO93_26570 [Mesorhizobium sp. 65-26]|nr:MAG: hypothetical protein BGO93_26570 [Mesorhizobium sp. 65-26]